MAYRITTITFPPSLKRNFSANAKKAFPNEIYALCLGRKYKQHVKISALFYPDNVKLTDDGAGLDIDISVFPLAAQIAKKDNLVLCGSIHSHPWTEDFPVVDATPSEVDWDGGKEHPSCVMHGICAVTEFDGKLHTRYRFWPIIKPIEIING